LLESGGTRARFARMSAIGNISSSLLNQLFTQVSPPSSLNSSSGGIFSSSAAQFVAPSDQGQLSPLGAILSSLQQLQQTNPTKYQQVTQQIATNLQAAAGTAQKAGNTAQANQLNQLASDFADAAKTGQLPNIQDLAKAVGGHHHQGRHAQAASQTQGTSQDSSQSASVTDPNGANSQATDPLAVILQTLQKALGQASAASA
jgi:hypothetical protein